MKYDTHTVVTIARGLAEQCTHPHGGEECWTGRHINQAIRTLRYLEAENFDLVKVKEK